MIDAGMIRGLAVGAGGRVATLPGPRAARWSPAAARGATLLLALAAAAAGFLATDPQTVARAVAFDPGLAWVLRAMAALKMAMAAAATAGVVWRLGGAASPGWLAGYALSLAAMWAGPGLIWDMAHLRLGALLLHGGLAGTLVLLWRDPAVGARLEAIIEARRRVLRERPGG